MQVLFYRIRFDLLTSSLVKQAHNTFIWIGVFKRQRKKGGGERNIKMTEERDVLINGKGLRREKGRIQEREKGYLTSQTRAVHHGGPCSFPRQPP